MNYIYMNVWNSLVPPRCWAQICLLQLKWHAVQYFVKYRKCLRYAAGQQERHPQECCTKYHPYSITNIYLLPHTKLVKLPHIIGPHLPQCNSLNGSKKVKNNVNVGQILQLMSLNRSLYNIYIYLYLFIYVYTKQYSTIVSNYNLSFSAWRHVSAAHATMFRPA